MRHRVLVIGELDYIIKVIDIINKIDYRIDYIRSDEEPIYIYDYFNLIISDKPVAGRVVEHIPKLILTSYREQELLIREILKSLDIVKITPRISEVLTEKKSTSNSNYINDYINKPIKEKIEQIINELEKVYSTINYSINTTRDITVLIIKGLIDIKNLYYINLYANKIEIIGDTIHIGF